MICMSPESRAAARSFRRQDAWNDVRETSALPVRNRTMHHTNRNAPASWARPFRARVEPDRRPRCVVQRSGRRRCYTPVTRGVMIKDPCGYAPSGLTVEALGAGRAALIGWPPLVVAGGPGVGPTAVSIAGRRSRTDTADRERCRTELAITVEGVAMGTRDPAARPLHHPHRPFAVYVHISDKTPKGGVRTCLRSFQHSVRTG